MKLGYLRNHAGTSIRADRQNTSNVRLITVCFPFSFDTNAFSFRFFAFPQDVLKFGFSSREYVLLHEKSNNTDDDED